MLDQQQIREFNRFATQIRIENLRQMANLGSGHVGGTMSLAEVLAVLYGGVMKIDPVNPGWEERDWLGIALGNRIDSRDNYTGMDCFFQALTARLLSDA